ncbi:MAG: hypothetical protein OXC95_11640 [Dehalococcoidia bacterium]|nr:hypothetical protein [Dehalococcoidia bacterium]
MSLQKISVFVTALLAVAVLVLAFMAYVQLSEVRQLRDELAIMQQASETENQGLREELASLRADVGKLDASEDLATIQQSISRLRLQTLDVFVEDEPLVTLQVPQIARPGLLVSNMPSLQSDADFWWEQSPDTVRTITRTDYGAEWPFETDEAILGCHGGDVIAVVYGGDFMVDSASPGLHSFLNDIADISVFDASSPELDAARDRMVEEAQSLCNAKIVR